MSLEKLLNGLKTNYNNYVHGVEVHGTKLFVSTDQGLKNMFKVNEDKQRSIKSELPANLMPLFDFVDGKSVVNIYKKLQNEKKIQILFSTNLLDTEFTNDHNHNDFMTKALDTFTISNTDLPEVKTLVAQITKKQIEDVINQHNKAQIMVIAHTNQKVFNFPDFDMLFNAAYFEFYKLNDKLYYSYYIAKFVSGVKNTH